ncbi:phosphotransferase family protein [Peribacillus butanolivorans]|uniref:phosphotransferase family protein n=1 Tax=Peribacillus butanolivorans TaxID=421767 RepID=UPI0036DBEBF2
MDQQKLSSPFLYDGIDWRPIETYIRKNIKDLPNESIEVKKFSAGYSNLTYLIKMGDWEAVFRKPPLGYIPPKAHDMKREYMILKRVSPVFPLAPTPYLYSENPAIMDQHFYVMEKKEGIVLNDHIPKEFEKFDIIGESVSKSVVKTLVRLHEIDYKAAELEDIGRPEGYLERQVKGWINRYEKVKTDDIPLVSELEQWLSLNIPHSVESTIVHNDFKINNLMLNSDDPSEVTGVFDWEMCTIGDPLTDIGSALAYWMEPGDLETGLSAVTNTPGFISRKQFLELYTKSTNRDLSNIDYYLTFAFYKIAVILQQIYYRWKQGKTDDNRFASLNIGIENLMLQAHRAKQKEVLR